MRSVLLLFALFAAGGASWAQSGATGERIVLGTVTDAVTARSLRGATVMRVGSSRGAVTDSTGRVALPVPEGAAVLRVSHVGFASQDVRVGAASDRFAVALVPTTLGEVAIRAASDRPERRVAMGQTSLGAADVRALPAFLGETDVLKAMQLLPGVRGGAEASAGLYVRGGSPDQTLVLLDGVPVYNSSHLFGFLSTFHPDALGSAELSRQPGSARDGGRLGGVLDVRLRAGDDRRLRVQGAVGVLAARVLAEGPLVPGRASFLVAARRTYLGLLAGPVVDRSNRKAAERGEAQIDPGAAFFDVNARLDARLSDRDRLSASVYTGGDVFRLESSDPVEACMAGACRATGESDRYAAGLDWGTRLGTLRYARRLAERAAASLTLLASDYGVDVRVDVEEGQGGPDATQGAARYRSGVRDLGARLDVDLAPTATHTVRLGVSATAHRFTPGALALTGTDASGDALDGVVASAVLDALHVSAYAEDAWQPMRALTVEAGLRAGVYTSGRYRYPSAEPRLAVAVRLHERVAVKASAALAQQPLHLLTTGAGVGLPADLWVPADSVGPARGAHLALGLAGSLPGGRTTWSLEGYTRSMRGLVAYRDGASFSTPFTDWQELVVTGRGQSAGVEALVQHRSGRVTALASYTLARSTRQFDALDGGVAFPYRYDRRHDASATATLRLARWLDLSATGVYGTGDAITLPRAVYDATPLRVPSPEYWAAGYAQSAEETAYGPRNRTRLPAYVRLDVGATVFFHRSERPHSLSLHVYNATNRKNPFLTRLESRADPATGETRQQLVGVALFPILPALSYQFAF